MKVKELKNYPNIYRLMKNKNLVINIYIIFSFFVILLCLFVAAALLTAPIQLTSIIVIILSLILASLYVYILIYIYLSYKKINDRYLQLVDCELADAVIYNATPYPACLTKSFLILYAGASLIIINISDIIKLDIGFLYSRYGGSTPYIHVTGKSKKTSCKQSIRFVNKHRRNNIDILIKKTNEQISISLLENI